MSVSAKLEKCLDEAGVKYTVNKHRVTYSAQQTAASVHTPGHEVAKVIVVKGGGKYVMAVTDAPHLLNLDKLATVAGLESPSVAEESEFRDLFGDCEVGAMPPFGQLYGMEVYVDSRMEDDDEIVFNAGTHFEVIRMKYADFKKLVNPVVGSLS